MVKNIDILEFEYYETTSKVEKFLLLRQFENCFAIDFSEFSGLQNFGIFLLKIALFKGFKILGGLQIRLFLIIMVSSLAKQRLYQKFSHIELRKIALLRALLAMEKFVL